MSSRILFHHSQSVYLLFSFLVLLGLLGLLIGVEKYVLFQKQLCMMLIVGFFFIKCQLYQVTGVRLYF